MVILITIRNYFFNFYFLNLKFLTDYVFGTAAV